MPSSLSPPCRRRSRGTNASAAGPIQATSEAAAEAVRKGAPRSLQGRHASIAAVAPFALALLLVLSPVRFPNSGSPAAQPAFLRGVTALHNFQYEDAVEAFREAQRIDRDFALAYWGEAMAHNQTLWLNQDAEAARTALRSWARRRRRARPGRGRTARKDYLRAVEALFGTGERAARDRAYADAMGGWPPRTRTTPRRSTFHALALMGTAARSPALLRDPGGDAHQHALVGSETRRRRRPSCRRSWRGTPTIRARSTT